MLPSGRLCLACPAVGKICRLQLGSKTDTLGLNCMLFGYLDPKGFYKPARIIMMAAAVIFGQQMNYL